MNALESLSEDSILLRDIWVNIPDTDGRFNVRCPVDGSALLTEKNKTGG